MRRKYDTLDKLLLGYRNNMFFQSLGGYCLERWYIECKFYKNSSGDWG